MIAKFLKGLKNAVSPNTLGRPIEGKRRRRVIKQGRNSKLRQWVDSLEGWQWWAWQLGPA